MRIHFQKLLSILCVIVLFASLTVPAFADDSIQVQDGYNVEDVPYNEAFEGVLTVSDSGSQLYSSSSNSTYSTPALLSAPYTNTSNVIYSYKSVTGFIPTNIWRGSNSPTVTFPINSNGYTAVNYVWSENDSSQSYYHFNSMSAFSKLQGGRRYRVTFSASFSRTCGSFVFYLANRKTSETVLVSLLDIANTINLSNSSKSVSIDFTLPEGASDVVPVIKGTVNYTSHVGFSFTELTFYVNDFTITDITNEDLDKSLDKFGDRLENAGSDELALDTDISAFQSAIDTMNGWLDQLDEFADSIDEAGQTANEYISKGTELFNGFMSVAPAAVIALVAFGVVFIVVRKIVGR